MFLTYEILKPAFSNYKARELQKGNTVHTGQLILTQLSISTFFYAWKM